MLNKIKHVIKKVKQLIVKKKIVYKIPGSCKVEYVILIVKSKPGMLRKIYGKDRVILNGIIITQSPDGIIRIRYRPRTANIKTIHKLIKGKVLQSKTIIVCTNKVSI